MSEIKPQDLEALLETFEASTWCELRLKIDGLEVFVSKTPGALPSLSARSEPAGALASPTPVQTQQPATATSASIPEGWVAVRAPNLGTFYRAPKPGAPPYVAIGQRVEPTTELCLIEVMKLFTSVAAGVSGVVRQILVEDTQLVEFDQALFLIETDA
ncbi:MAG TPA: biotin/lipoyl-containing protein [Roseiarcus sp.]|jgi:acetyl-CoA carboxylase biotin carboxyl carrier protein